MNQNTSKIKNIKRVLAPVARVTTRAMAPRIKPRLKPSFNIHETDVANTGTWTATGDDPQFRCQFPFIELHTGWYMITLDIECDKVFDVAKIYVDMGRGFDEEEVISMPFQSRKLCKRVVRFDRKANQIRFDPLNCSGKFTVREFSISPVTFKFAESRMLKKLARWSPTVLENTEAGAKDMLQRQARNTGRDYRELLTASYAALFSAPLDNQNYCEWIESVESADLPPVSAIEAIASQPGRPLISVIMPAYNTDPRLLDMAVESVISQTYADWQLCISDGGSSRTDTIYSIKSWLDKDDRIDAAFSDRSLGIAENTNAALDIARGDYCVFLDHDDLLAANALYEIATRAVEHPGLQLIYSDEDKIDESGVRVDPHFKSDWNPDLLLSQNYICHLVALKRDLLDRLGGCRTGFEGAQDHDLLLRVMEQVSEDQVCHIPKVLYHWRMTPVSTASSAEAKSYSTDSGLRAVSEHLSRTESDAVVEQGRYPNTYRVKWNVTGNLPKVSIVIPTRDRVDILSQCISSVLERTDYPDYEIIVVDNESTEADTFEYFDEIDCNEKIRVLKYDGEFNYSAINNFAVSQADGSVITMMNNDIEVISSDWLTEMVGHVMRDEVGCVGAKLLYKNNLIQHAGVILGIGGVAGHAHKYFDSDSAGYFSRLHLTQNLSAVTAACLTVRKRTYQQVGGFNESDLKVAFNDVDFCLKVGALGLRNVWTPYAVLYHHESISRGHENTDEKRMRFNSEALYMREQWGELLRSDPAYNRNLTLAREDFSLAA